jgi:molecular chaperone Hsp33
MSSLLEYDQLQPFMFDNMPVRGAIVRLHATYQAALSKHLYAPVAQGLLADALTSISLLTHTVKLNGSIALQAQGQGPVSLLLAECTHDFHLRGLVHHKNPLVPGNLDDLFGKGLMAITMKANDLAQDYQGVVPLEGQNIAQALEGYFSQSEQLPTRIFLAHDGLSTCGLLLQTVPGHESHQGKLDWEHITTLANTLRPEELLGLNNREILFSLYHQEAVRLFDPHPVCFRCSCSRTRMEAVLVSLGQEELLSILNEFGTVDTFCEFCNHHYLFDAVDIHQIMADDSNHYHSNKEH